MAIRKSKVEKENRKGKGEVFTPPSLAKEMVDTLTEVGIDYKVLDPCAGATFVFPIMYMFKYIRTHGKENLVRFVNNMCVAELNELALEYGSMIFMSYVKLLESTDPDKAEKIYFDSFDDIVNGYYDYCEAQNEGI